MSERANGVWNGAPHLSSDRVATDGVEMDGVEAAPAAPPNYRAASPDLQRRTVTGPRSVLGPAKMVAHRISAMRVPEWAREALLAKGEVLTGRAGRFAGQTLGQAIALGTLAEEAARQVTDVAQRGLGSLGHSAETVTTGISHAEQRNADDLAALTLSARDHARQMRRRVAARVSPRILIALAVMLSLASAAALASALARRLWHAPRDAARASVLVLGVPTLAAHD
ncbi:MAG: hypothetical protein IVW57_03670 [Ktedonobacterales bacterium]|nr:hypothetical protein [Ktedonobacterales bacterium]